MRLERRPHVIAVLAAVLVAALVVVSAAVEAIRQRDWGPIVSVAWIPAVITAAWPGAYRRCRPGRGPVG